jgi:hypothetical protein
MGSIVAKYGDEKLETADFWRVDERPGRAEEVKKADEKDGRGNGAL